MFSIKVSVVEEGEKNSCQTALLITTWQESPVLKDV